MRAGREVASKGAVDAGGDVIFSTGGPIVVILGFDCGIGERSGLLASVLAGNDSCAGAHAGQNFQ